MYRPKQKHTLNDGESLRLPIGITYNKQTKVYVLTVKQYREKVIRKTYPVNQHDSDRQALRNAIDDLRELVEIGITPGLLYPEEHYYYNGDRVIVSIWNPETKGFILKTKWLKVHETEEDAAKELIPLRQKSLKLYRQAILDYLPEIE